MKTILFSTLALAATTVMAQERTVEHPDFETCSAGALKLEKVTYGGDTTKVTFSYKGWPNYWFQISSKNSICADGACHLSLGADCVKFDSHIYPHKSDSTITFTLFFPHIDASTKSITWQVPEGWFYNNVQLQPGASLAHLAVPQSLRDKCLKIKGSKSLETPKLEPGETTIKGRIYGSLGRGEGFKAVVNNAITCAQETYNIDVAEDGTFEVRIALPISTQSVMLITDEMPTLTMLATTGEVQEVYLDNYTFSHSLDLRAEEAPHFMLFAGANAAANNSLCSPKALEVWQTYGNWTNNLKTNELEEYRDLANSTYNVVETTLDAANLDPVAVEYMKMAIKHQLIQDLGTAKHRILNRHYRNGRIRLPEDEQARIKEAKFPEDFLDMMKTADLNNLKNLTLGDHCYRDLTFSLVHFVEIPNQDKELLAKSISGLANATQEQKAFAERIAKSLTAGESIVFTEDEQKILMDLHGNELFLEEYTKHNVEVYQKNKQKAEQFFKEMVGIKSEHDMAIQIYRISTESDPLWFDADTIQEAHLKELSEHSDAFYVQSLRDASNRVKAKLEARKPLIRSNVHNEKTEGDFLQSVADKFPGKVLLVDIWATWCGPCLSISNMLNDLSEKYKDDMVLVRIADENSPEDEWKRLTGNMTGEHYRLTKAEIKEVRKRSATESGGYPTLFIIDKMGEFRKVARHHMESDIEKAIATGDSDTRDARVNGSETRTIRYF